MHAFLADQQAHAGSDNKAEALSRHFDDELYAPMMFSCTCASQRWLSRRNCPYKGQMAAPRAHVHQLQTICFQMLQAECFGRKPTKYDIDWTPGRPLAGSQIPFTSLGAR